MKSFLPILTVLCVASVILLSEYLATRRMAEAERRVAALEEEVTALKAAKESPPQPQPAPRQRIRTINNQ